MSNFFHPMTRQVSRKVHQCECCYYAIEKGAMYCRQNGIWEGEYFSSPYHPECWDALAADGTFEFTPGDGAPPEGARPFSATLKTAQTIALPGGNGEAECEALREDAARYKLLRRGQHWSVINGIGDTLRAEELDAAIDAARAAAKQGEGS